MVAIKRFTIKRFVITLPIPFQERLSRRRVNPNDKGYSGAAAIDGKKPDPGTENCGAAYCPGRAYRVCVLVIALDVIL
ncbi:MAG: hypothetical protein OEV42_11755 [Deltaproteobacteria bacterium]|nr:hypothetical protein [Deltaproteobacteria bacterium]